ncbi:MraW methylase family-domain-containing protein [Chytridium lagenaria]|nr:MraW methylase family-domain-containing protein [Chytridium lagenaria]
MWCCRIVNPNRYSGIRRISTHIPVLLNEVLTHIKPSYASPYVFVDATFGTGDIRKDCWIDTYDCKVIAIDQDPQAIKKSMPDGLIPLHGRFGDMKKLLSDAGMGLGSVDGILMDIGMSSGQIDDASRGFSYRAPGTLDMRMSYEKGGGMNHISDILLTAEEVVNTFSFERLALIIGKLGEEPRAKRIARAIVRAREIEPFKDSAALSALVVRTADKRERFSVSSENHPAAKTRLEAAESLLRRDGKLVTITFHSLEDRIVKNFMKDCSLANRGLGLRFWKNKLGKGYSGIDIVRSGSQEIQLSRQPASTEPSLKKYRENQKPVTLLPSSQSNPLIKSSAKLRSAERTEHPAFFKYTPIIL